MTAPERVEWRTGKKVKPVNLLVDEAWMEDAACSQTDPELFFPEKGKPALPAIKVCLGCIVQNECLQYALQHNMAGVWGGMSEDRRRRLRRKLGIVSVAAIPHGTSAGARAHYRAGEKPCASCAEANRVEKRLRKAAAK